MSISSTVNPKQLDIDGIAIAPVTKDFEGGDLLDKDWAKIAFMVPDAEIGDYTDIINRYYTTASAKFTDTRLGCNIGINPKPQWTRYCDIRQRGRIPDRNYVSLADAGGNYGMGSAYSEGIDDPAQKIFLKFGVPKFNSLANFLLKAFSREMTIMARTGRAPSAWYTLGNVAGTALMAVAFPALTIAVFSGKTIAWLINRPTSKFFTLKPTMFLYWNMVNHLVMNHAVNTGLIKKVLDNDNQQRLGRPYKIDDTQIQMLESLFPDLFRDGTFDILAMATKAQRMANMQFEADFNNLNKGTESNFEGYLRRDTTGSGTHSTNLVTPEGTPKLSALLDNLVRFGRYYTAEKDESFISELDPRVSPDAKPETSGEKSLMADHIDSMKKYMDAEMRDGAEFAIFRVDHTGSVQESFGNSLGESEISQKLNSMSSSIREARFSIAEGNIDGGLLDNIKGAIGSIATGALDAVSFGFAGLIAGLGGSGYIDIPKHWQSSSANLPRGSYKLKLISPYNNPVSRMMNIWIPFYMLLAGALPRSVGKQAYTSPFYCQIYDRGRLQSRLAMIESLSVTRGTSNLQFDLYGQCLAIDVSFTVVDLSTIMHMPVSSGAIGDFDATIDEDNIAADYLNVLAGMDIYSQIYAIPRAQLLLSKKLAQLKYKATSPAFHTALFKHSMSDGFLNDITLGGSGFVMGLGQAAVQGSSNIDGNRN